MRRTQDRVIVGRWLALTLFLALGLSACFGVDEHRRDETLTPAPVTTHSERSPVAPPVTPTQSERVSVTPVAPITHQQLERVATVLRGAGYWNGNVSEASASSLREPLRHFQRDAGLPATGQLDPPTRQKLLADRSSPPASRAGEAAVGLPRSLTSDVSKPLDVLTANPLPPVVQPKKITPPISVTSLPAVPAPSVPSAPKAQDDPPRPAFDWQPGEQVWVMETHECKGVNESWQTLYRGVLQQVANQRVTVKLEARSGLWYDRRASGRSEQGWWCIPTRRLCSESIRFSDANGTFKPGDLANFPAAHALPARFDVAALVAERFQEHCQRRSSAIIQPKQSGFFPEPLRDEIAHLIAYRHFKRPHIADSSSCCTNDHALTQYLSSLDPYSRYLSPEEQTFTQRRDARHVNLGLNLLPFDQRVLAVPIAGGPADRAGLQRPAWVTALNGIKLSLNEVASYAYLGELLPGTLIPLETTEAGHPHVYRLTAADDPRPDLEYQARAEETWIRIHRFSDGQDRELRKLLQRGDNRGKPLVLDLRFCPGGSLYAAVDAASLFLPAELPVVTLVAKETSPRTLQTLSGRLALHVPVAVFVGPLTASAAEIFVRALARHAPEIPIIGLPTTGKCLAQESVALSSVAGLALSVFALEDAGGILCQGAPIQPKFEVAPKALLDDTAYRAALSKALSS